MNHTITIHNNDIYNDSHEISDFCLSKNFDFKITLVETPINQRLSTFVVEHKSNTYSVGICDWDTNCHNCDVDGVEDESDEAMCFDMSTKIVCGSVHIIARQEFMVILASNIESVKDALTHVQLCEWDPQGI